MMGGDWVIMCFCFFICLGLLSVMGWVEIIIFEEIFLYVNMMVVVGYVYDIYFCIIDGESCMWGCKGWVSCRCMIVFGLILGIRNFGRLVWIWGIGIRWDDIYMLLI